MEQTISANGGSINFNYTLGCGSGSSVTGESNVEWITVGVDDSNNVITVNVAPNTSGEDREGTVKILINGIECLSENARINFTQQKEEGGGGDDCPTHSETIDCTDYSQEEVVSINFHVTGETTFDCNGGTVTVQPYVTYTNYCLVTSNTVDCHGTVISSTTSKKNDPQGNKTKNVGEQSSFTFDAIDCTQIPVGETRTNEHTFNASYGGKTTALTVTQTCQSCEEPEEHNPFFEVNFNQLNGGSWYYNELRNLGAPFVVSSSTWNGSSYQWTDVTITIDDTNYAQYITFDNGTPIAGNTTAKTFRMKFKDNMPNEPKNGIHVTVKQNGTDLSSGATFNVLHLDDILYNDIRPYVVRISYERPSTESPSGVPERYGYYLHFKSYGDTNPFNDNYTTNEPITVNNKVTFFADDNNCFTTFINGSDCAGQSCGHPQGLSNRPYINANESDTLVYDANPITYANNIKNGLFLRNATEACVGVDGSGFVYRYSETDIDFLGATSGSTIMQGYKSGASSVDSYYDGVRSVYLKIPDQSELQIVEGPHVLKASQVTFNSDDGDTTVSVYEDGIVFVDSSDTVFVGEAFSSITQFEATAYPDKSYNSIQACQLFNGTVPLDDFGKPTCFNDIVIEDGELIRRDESIPSPTVAMHIELDEEPSDTQAMHIETDNN